MTKRVDLFTAEEHLVLARWLRQEPLERPNPTSTTVHFISPAARF